MNLKQRLHIKYRNAIASSQPLTTLELADVPPGLIDLSAPRRPPARELAGLEAGTHVVHGEADVHPKIMEGRSVVPGQLAVAGGVPAGRGAVRVQAQVDGEGWVWRQVRIDGALLRVYHFLMACHCHGSILVRLTYNAYYNNIHTSIYFRIYLLVNIISKMFNAIITVFLIAIQ